MSTIAQLFPEQLDVNGDAQNALVLAARAGWGGIETQIVPFSPSDRPPSEAPGLVVIGSGVDAEIGAVARALSAWAGTLGEWLAAGVPMIAVGTGFELLTRGIRMADGSEHQGLGIIDCTVSPLAVRASEDLVIDTPLGRMLGYENHARGITELARDQVWASVVRGTGNGGGHEGARVRNLIGTHLHGPVLAKNPALADELLKTAFGEQYRPDDERIRRVDDYAREARKAIARACGVALDA